jgi:GT2 family glycosyltransferase
MSTSDPVTSEKTVSAGTTATPDISIVIVSWNARAYLEECLASLAVGITRTHEVIVVDNASGDGSPEMVREKFPSVRLVSTGANLGFAKGNNIGFSHAAGRYLCLVNSDVVVFPGTIDVLADYLDRHPAVGLVGPRILNSDRTTQPTARAFPTFWNNACVVFGLSRLFPHSPSFSAEEMRWFGHDVEKEVEVLVGCFIMARADAVREIGGLDESFFMYAEDLDWCQRFRAAGRKVIFFPGASSIHHGGASSSSAPSRFAVEQQTASIQLWRKYHSPVSTIIFCGLLLLHSLLRVIRELAKAALHGHWTEAGRLNYQSQRACMAALVSGKSRNRPDTLLS